MDICATMKSLSRKRGIFHLESDFQFALVWEIKCLYPDCEMRLEVPFALGKRGRIDIVVRLNGNTYPIELKYLKRSLHHSIDGEKYVLANGVHDMEMYDCIKDIARIETYLAHDNSFSTGYAVWLKNDRDYRNDNYDASYFREFHAPDGSEKTGKMQFIWEPKILNQKGYKSPIILNGSYRIKWNDYSDLGITHKGLFKYTAITVTR